MSAVCGRRVSLRCPSHPHTTKLSPQRSLLIPKQSLGVWVYEDESSWDDFWRFWQLSVGRMRFDSYIWGFPLWEGLRWELFNNPVVDLTSGLGEVTAWVYSRVSWWILLHALKLMFAQISAVYHSRSVCLWGPQQQNELLVGFHHLVFCFCSSTGASQLATRKAPGAWGVRGGLPLLWRWHGTRASRQAGALWSRLSRNQQGWREQLKSVRNTALTAFILGYKTVYGTRLKVLRVFFFSVGGERSGVWDSAAEEFTPWEDCSVLRLSSGPWTEETHHFCWVYAWGMYSAGHVFWSY